MLKRLLDVIVSLIVLAVLAVPLALVLLVLKLTGEGEALYFQKRVGYGGKLIYLTKFATMLKNSPNMGTQDITLKNDPRVLPFGRFLRKTKLNEMPQFWDVLIGKLSLVGWRPLMPQGFESYPETVRVEIVKAKPGLTGIGSLVFRDEESIIAVAEEQGMDLRECYRNEIMPYKGALEIWYVQNRGLWTDLKILAGTAIAVLYPGWHGYFRWFSDLPTPVSPLIRSHLELQVQPVQSSSLGKTGTKLRC